MAEKLVDKFLIKQLDTRDSDEDESDEDEDPEAVKVVDGKEATPDKISSHKGWCKDHEAVISIMHAPFKTE